MNHRQILAAALLAGVVSTAAAHAAGVTETKVVRGKDARGTFNLQYLRIVSTAIAARVRTVINKALAKAATSHLCDADRAQAANMSSSFTMKVTYLNRYTLGVAEAYDSFCGGAYPDAGSSARIFDLRTGAQIDVESQVRDAARLRQTIVAAFRGGKRQAECRELYAADALAGATFHYTPTSRGMEVARSGLPHAAQACTESRLLPYASVARLAKPGSVLTTLKPVKR